MVEDIVEHYLKKVENTLEGLDTKEKASILFELESHIMEKASEIAKEKGLKHPTKNIFEKTIQKLGDPEKLGKGYLKVSKKGPKLNRDYQQDNKSRWRKMIYFAGALTIAIGIFLTLIRRVSYTNHGYYADHTFVPLSWGIIIFGIIIVAYARWIYSSRVTLYVDNKQKMINFIGILLISIGSFLTLVRIPGEPGGAHSTFPFIPWSFIIILFGIIIVAYANWIYVSEKIKSID
jgi:uncharacterized membrane protein